MSMGFDPTGVAQFANTGTGQKWTPQQIQGLYTAYGIVPAGAGAPSSYVSANAGQGAGSVNTTNTAIDPALIAAYQEFTAGNSQTQQNWTNYSDLVNANEGGEGDTTVTAGAATSATSQALGSLAGVNVNAPTTPTTGLGSMGAQSNLVKNGVAVGAPSK
jgi:hypothetical protein